MSQKEGVLVEVNPNIPEPYQGYIRTRNGQIGKDIALLLGIPFRGFTADQVDQNQYIIASKTITTANAHALGIHTPDDFYGLAIDNLHHVGKTILHPAINKNTPPFYQTTFSKRVQTLVLPGITCFSTEDLDSAYQQTSGNGFDLRFKVAGESDGNGQYQIENRDHLMDIIEKEEQSLSEGVVLEANINDPKTISVGHTKVGEKKYSFIAHQKNSETDKAGQSRYLGAKVTVIPGELDQLLLDKSLTINEQLAVIKAVGFHRLYQEVFNPIASRISYDVVIGLDNHGDILSGVTDITGRVGGTCPALMLACLQLNDDPSIKKVLSEVTLNYCPDTSLSEEENSTLYIDEKTLRISARVNEIVI